MGYVYKVKKWFTRCPLKCMFWLKQGASPREENRLLISSSTLHLPNVGFVKAKSESPWHDFNGRTGVLYTKGASKAVTL